MTGQDLGLPITDLRPGRVTNLFRKAYNKNAVSVYVCEFATDWYEDALDNGRWPAPEGDNDPDQVFARYLGRLNTALPGPRHHSCGLHPRRRGGGTGHPEQSVHGEQRCRQLRLSPARACACRWRTAAASTLRTLQRWTWC
ncbi:DUF1834 family protein [Pantoea sp. Eser]|nr:DUF1834 family protein [Pantoea sp. Eser]